jgi:hypothetical protein
VAPGHGGDGVSAQAVAARGKHDAAGHTEHIPAVAVRAAFGSSAHIYRFDGFAVEA